MSDKLFRIENHHSKGRQLVAARRIQAGELIIDEPALVTCPSFSHSDPRLSQNTALLNVGNEISSASQDPVNEFHQDDVSVCLVCCANLQAALFVRCPSCNFLLCSENCRAHVLHTQNECHVLAHLSHVWTRRSNRSKKSLYNLVSVVRGLFYKFRNATKWAQITNLESKSEALEKIGAFEDLEDVFNSLSWRMFSSEPSSPSERENNQTNEDKLENICDAAKHCMGVMRINAFSEFSESYSREGIFFLSSFMSHSCVVNTDRQIGSETGGGLRMVVRASVDIEKDEPITTTYLSLLYNTEERHRIMMSSWLFLCSCLRCQDPTECQVLSGEVFRNNPPNHQECFSIEGKSILNEITKARPHLSNIPEIEKWLDSYDNNNYVHPNHSVFSHVKLFLCQYYGRQAEGLNQLSVSQLRRKVRYCWELLNVYEKVSPGVQIIKGVINFELYNGLQRLVELDEIPVSFQFPSKVKGHVPDLSLIVLSDKDLVAMKMQALNNLQYALPGSSEEGMANCLRDDLTTTSSQEDL